MVKEKPKDWSMKNLLTQWEKRGRKPKDRIWPSSFGRYVKKSSKIWCLSKKTL